jgi:formylglycine-generating enzyme required for sulfatase activity
MDCSRIKRLWSVFICAYLWLPSILLAAERGMAVEEVLGKDASVPAYHALVIGINNYKHWQQLRQARQDAEKLADLLKSSYGFADVCTLYDRDATRQNILLQLRKLAKQLNANDALLIYYAGHGYYDKVLNEGFWVPSDAHERIDNEPATSDWLTNDELRKHLTVMKARHVLVISDSCFSGALFRGGQPDLAAKENTWYRRALSQPSRWAISSGDLETVPDQSTFAQKFVQLLEYPRQSVFSASDVAGWLKKEVAELTGRQPLFGPLKDSSDSPTGEFVFLKRAISRPEGRAPSRPPTVTPSAPSIVQLFGALVVKSPKAASVSVDGGSAVRIGAGQALKWDKLAVGKHTVRVEADGKARDYAVNIREDLTETVMAVFGGAIGDTKTLNLPSGVKLELVWIPAGEFIMRSNDELEGEKPVHKVKISQGFWMGKYEVTQEQYEAVTGKNPSYRKGAQLPVERVSWNDAVAFCQKIGARLPTEAEWEYACRAGTTTKYSSGDDEADLGRVGWYRGNSDDRTHEAGQKEANGWGLYDMHGNVWEWCADWYGSYPSGEQTDPTGPSSGELRVLRGGSFINEPGHCRCAYRRGHYPDFTYSLNGFRVVVGSAR